MHHVHQIEEGKIFFNQYGETPMDLKNVQELE